MSQRQLSDDGQYRRILTNFGGSGEIQGTEDVPITLKGEDAKAIGVATLLGFVALALAPPSFEALGWVVAAAIVVTTLGVIYVAPSNLSPLAWLAAIARFKRAPKRLTAHAESDRRRTQTLTHVDAVLSLSGSVRRRDGTLVGAIQVAGRDMALAESAEWDTAARGFEDLANALDGAFEIYSPSRVVASQDLVDGYWGRETDADVKANDALAGLIEDYKNELPRELRERGAAVRDFYVLVWVSPDEVRRADHGVIAKLADLPGVGGFVSRVGLARRGPSDAEIKTRQKSILAGRKRAVETAVAAMEGCDASPVDAEHLTAILKEFWTGRRVRKSGKPVPNTTVPVVTRGDDENAADTGGY